MGVTFLSPPIASLFTEFYGTAAIAERINRCLQFDGSAPQRDYFIIGCEIQLLKDHLSAKPGQDPRIQQLENLKEYITRQLDKTILLSLNTIKIYS